MTHKNIKRIPFWILIFLALIGVFYSFSDTRASGSVSGPDFLRFKNDSTFVILNSNASLDTMLAITDSLGITYLKSKDNASITILDLLNITDFTLVTGAGVAAYDATDVPTNGQQLTWATGDIINWQDAGAGGSARWIDLTNADTVTLVGINDTLAKFEQPTATSIRWGPGRDNANAPLELAIRVDSLIMDTVSSKKMIFFDQADGMTRANHPFGLEDNRFWTKHEGPDGDQFHYFFEVTATGAHLKWDNTATGFELSHKLAVLGDVDIGTNSIVTGAQTILSTELDRLAPVVGALYYVGGTDVIVADGGTGLSTLTNGGFLFGTGTSPVTVSVLDGNGDVMVGDGAAFPVALTLLTSSTGFVLETRGGMEVDVSGFVDGLYGMASSATIDIDTETELETAIGDVSAFFTNNVTGDVTVAGATSTIGATTVEFSMVDASLTRTTNSLLTGEAFWSDSGNGGIIFEGVTANEFEGLLTVVDLTTPDKLWTLPDASGTIQITGVTIVVADGGTGATTLLDGGVLLGAGTSPVTGLAVVTVGALIIGDGTLAPGSAVLGGDATLIADGTMTIADDAVQESDIQISNTGVIGNVLYKASGDELTYLTPNGAAGTFLRSGGVGVVPTWATPAGSGLWTQKGTADSVFVLGTGTSSDTLLMITRDVTTNASTIKGGNADGSLAIDADTVRAAGVELVLGVVGLALADSLDATLLRTGKAGEKYHFPRDSGSHLMPLVYDTIGDSGKWAFLDSSSITANSLSMTGDIQTFTKTELEGRTSDVANYAEADGDVFTGVHDFGGVTSFEIWNAAAPVPAVEGQLAWANTINALLGHDGTNDLAVATARKSRSFVIATPAAADDFPFWQTPYAITLINVSAICIAGTNVIGQLQEYTGTATTPVNTMTVDLTVLTTETTSSTWSNAIIDAGDWLGWKTTSVSGAVTHFCITFEYEIR